MYSMSVSIHRIYSSVTLFFSVVLIAALLPSEDTQVRTKFTTPAKRVSLFQRENRFSPV